MRGAPAVEAGRGACRADIALFAEWDRRQFYDLSASAHEAMHLQIADADARSGTYAGAATAHSPPGAARP
jgi:hypothetical protein